MSDTKKKRQLSIVIPGTLWKILIFLENITPPTTINDTTVNYNAVFSPSVATNCLDISNSVNIFTPGSIPVLGVPVEQHIFPSPSPSLLSFTPNVLSSSVPNPSMHVLVQQQQEQQHRAFQLTEQLKSLYRRPEDATTLHIPLPQQLSTQAQEPPSITPSRPVPPPIIRKDSPDNIEAISKRQRSGSEGANNNNNSPSPFTRISPPIPSGSVATSSTLETDSAKTYYSLTTSTQSSFSVGRFCLAEQVTAESN